MTQRELWEMIGAGGGGRGEMETALWTHYLLVYWNLSGVFLYWKHHKKKKWPSTEQATNETVAKKILEVTFCKSRQISVAVDFIISVNFFFHFYLGMVMYVNEFETRENKN